MSSDYKSSMREVEVMGLPLDEWRYKSCLAYFAVAKEWASLYFIKSKKPGEGHATILLTEAKDFYEKEGKLVGGSVALNPRMAEIYKRLGYKEYTKSDE